MESNASRNVHAARPQARPVETRIALARLPAWTQRYWTWLSGIAMPTEMKRRPWAPWQHVLCTVVALAVAAAVGVYSAQALYTTLVHFFA